MSLFWQLLNTVDENYQKSLIFSELSEFSKKFRAKNVVAELFPKLEFLAKNVKNELK